MKSLFFIVVLTVFSLPFTLSAAVPTSPPTIGVPGGGYFSQYFDNIANQTYSVTSTVGSPCGVNSVIVGFETTLGNTFLSSKCRNMNTFLGTIMTSAVGGPGQAVTAFNPTTGAPIYSVVSGGTSQWTGTPPGNIYYNTLGNVGIGTSTPAYKLDVNSDVINNGWYRSRGASGWYSETYGGGIYMADSTWVRTYGAKSIWTNSTLGSNAGLTVGYGGAASPAAGAIISGNVGIGTAAPTQKLHVVGNVLATGFLYSSDKNLKQDITPLSDSLSKILSLNGYAYNWKSTGQKDIGVIAQEVEEVYPELVHTDASGIKSVEYANLIAPLIEAIKEQQKEIDALKSQVVTLSQK